MIIKYRVTTLLAISALALATAARANDIVNTGPGNPTVPGWTLGSPIQSLAGEFTLSSAETVSAVYGWIGDDYLPNPGDNTPGENDTPGLVDVSILSGNPSTGPVVFSGSVNIGPDSAPNWYGPSGLNLALSPGAYWVEFAGDTAYTAGGFLGYMTYGVANPLEGYDYNDGSGYNAFPLDFGVQIVGAGSSSAPDGGNTALLLVAGVAGLAFAASRRRLAVA